MHTHQTRTVLRWATMSLGSLSLALVAYSFSAAPGGTDSIEGRLLPQHLREEKQKWVTFSEEDILAGITLPAHTNVIIHIPNDIVRITRRTLFGRRGTPGRGMEAKGMPGTRYWGYCFPETYDQAQELRRRGFPGTLFLSEEERKIRSAFESDNRDQNFSVYRNINPDDLNRTTSSRGIIHHQMEIFRGGQTCYVMSENPLPLGADEDDDGANSAIETNYGSDPNNIDSDGDGIRDGLEIFRLGTHPTKRDSDGDGLIDGIEDANRNGIVDKTETDPTQWDTDRDKLCDGLCKVNKGRELRGEDKNLNGLFEPDLNETDPRFEDTDRNGVLDEQEYFNCLLQEGADC